MTASARRDHSYGARGLTLADRLGVYLSTRAIRREVAGRRELVALDLGCGYHATHLRLLRPVLAEGLGVDVEISPDAKAQPGLTLIESPIEAALAGLPAARCDLILMISVLEHLWDPQAVLEECRRVLKMDGRILVNVPTWLGKRALEWSAFRLGTSAPDEVDDHKMYYDRRDLWPLLVRAGFKPRHIRMRYHKFGLNLFATARKG